MPKVSVLIPVYNSAAYLEEAIASILSQTFSDFELLLLNDASTDNSANIIKKFSDPRIRYFENKHNLGISGSRNKLMELARGEYFAVMDNDDVSLPRRLARQVDFLDKHPDVAMVGSWGELFCKSPPAPGLWGKLKQKFINLGWVWCQPAKPDITELLCGNPVMHSSSMLRRSALERDGIKYNPDFTPAEDFDLCRQIIAAGWQLANIPEVLFRYHYHGENFSLTNKSAMRLADKKVKQDVLRLTNFKSFRCPYALVMLRKLRLKYIIRKTND